MIVKLISSDRSLGCRVSLLDSCAVLIVQPSLVVGERQQGVICSGRSVLVRAWPVLHAPAPLSEWGCAYLSATSSRRWIPRVLGRQLMGNLCRYALRKRIILFSRLPGRLVDSPRGSSLPGWLARRSGLRERFSSPVFIVEPCWGSDGGIGLGAFVLQRWPGREERKVGARGNDVFRLACPVMLIVLSCRSARRILLSPAMNHA